MAEAVHHMGEAFFLSHRRAHNREKISFAQMKAAAAGNEQAARLQPAPRQPVQFLVGVLRLRQIFFGFGERRRVENNRVEPLSRTRMRSEQIEPTNRAVFLLATRSPLLATFSMTRSPRIGVGGPVGSGKTMLCLKL